MRSKKLSFGKNVLLAIYIGLLTGLLAGLLDTIAKLVKQSYEYFEFYQSMLQSSVVMILAFLVLSLIMELIRRTWKIKPLSLRVFYPLSAMAFMAVFIIHITIKNALFPDKTLIHPVSLLIGLILVLVIGIIYIILLAKKQKGLEKGFKKANKVVSQVAWFLCVFIIASLIIDIIMLSSNKVESYKSIVEGPNVVFVVIDTQRADHLSLYGYPKLTSPNIDAFAENAVVFNNAVSPSSWTLPSHASLFTGTYLSNHEANTQTQYLSSDALTLAEVLKKKGYYTAGFVANAYVKARYGFHQGFMTYDDRVDFFEFNVKYDSYNLMEYLKPFMSPVHKAFMRLAKSDNEMNVEEMHAKILPWLDKNHDTPFFLFINYMDVHDPYNLGREYRHLYTDEPLSRSDKIAKNFNLNQKRNQPVSADDVELLLALYDAEITYFDAHLQELFDKLEALGIVDETLVIITSDHGEEFYEHNGWLHGQTLYEEVIHVPLIIKYPGVEPKRIDHRVNNINLYSTILEFMNVQDPDGVDSISLKPLITGEGNFDRGYTYNELVGRPSLHEPEFQQAITQDGWKLITVTPEHDVVPSALLDLESDPGEKKNVYNQREDKQEELKSAMDTAVTKDKTYK